MNEPTNGSENSPHPLDPVRTIDRACLKWLAIVLAINLAGLLWLAAREDSPHSIRLVLDSLLQVGGGVVLAYAAYRSLAMYPFRILDLVWMVIVLAFGVKATLETLHRFYRTGLLLEGQMDSRENFGMVLQACLISSSVLLAGATLGLRYCFRLKLE